MKPVTIQKRESSEELTLQFGGRVELTALPKFRECVMGVRKQRVVLDFSHVDFTSDAALGAMVTAFPPEQVVCLGLDSHHARIVQYLKTAAMPAF